MSESSELRSIGLDGPILSSSSEELMTTYFLTVAGRFLVGLCVPLGFCGVEGVCGLINSRARIGGGLAFGEDILFLPLFQIYGETIKDLNYLLSSSESEDK
jgi:hypothetical protein